MSKKHKAFVRILNPVGSAYTSLKQATSYVTSGKAKWEGGSIRFTEKWSERAKSSSTWHYILKYRLRTQDQAGYDSIDRMTLPQIQGLPLAGPAIKLISKGSSHFKPRAPHCKTLVA